MPSVKQIVNAMKKLVVPQRQQPNQKKKPRKVKANRKKRSAGRQRGNMLYRALQTPSAYPGMKWPDENSMPTVPYQSRDVIGVTTNASGICVVQINPCLKGLVNVANSVAIVDTTTLLSSWTSVNTSNYVNLSNTYDSARCVGLEIRFICSQTAVSAQGTILFSSLPQSSTIVKSPSTISSQQALDIQHVMIPLGRTINQTAFMHCRTLDFMSREFIDVTSGICEGWSSLIVAIYGATPTVTLGSIEVIANWELLLKPSTAAIGATPSLPYNVQAISEAVNLLNTTPVMSLGATIMGGTMSYVLGKAADAARPRNGFNRYGISAAAA